MRFHHKLFAGVVVLAGLLATTSSAEAQDFSLAVAAAPNPAVVNGPLAYTITITNTSGFERLNVFVTNSFSAPVAYVGFTETPAALINAIFTNSTEVIFQIGTFPGAFVEQIALTVLPLAAGSLTNQVTLLSFGRPSVTTRIATTVTRPSTDLAISLTNVSTAVFVGDTTTLGLAVSNLGPNAAAGVIVSNTLPPSFELLSVTPTNASTVFTNGHLVWNIGALASGSVTQLLALVRPTNGGTFNLTAAVSASGVTDTNAVNNTATNSMTINAIISSNLLVTVITPQAFNPQTGLMEEVVRVTNNGTNAVPAVRLLVSGLTTNSLYNAVGTNNGNPFVTYNATLAAGDHVLLLLEYFVRQRVALTNLNRTAVGVSPTTVTVPTNAPPNIMSQRLTGGGFLIEFQSIPGRSYTILYADNMSFTNTLVAQPAVVAPADRVQWIDNGPPKTISPPLNAGSRFYRVILNP